MVCVEPVQLLPPAPWGSPPTPLLPRWHLETLSTVPLPAELLARPSYSASAVPGRVLGDLAQIWQLRSEPVAVGALRTLLQLVSRYPDPPWDHVVIPPGADLSRLLECPFRTRAMNCIRMAVKSGRLRPDGTVTVGQLLSLKNLGRSTLLEVMCVAEAATDNGFLTSTCSTRTPELSPSPLPAEPVDCSNDGWGNVVPLLKRLLAVSIEFHGARTLSDALTSDLGKLMTTLSMAASFDRVPLANLAMGQTMAEEFLLALAEFWESLSPREQLIFEHRVASKSRTLEDLGSKLDLTRERVRQIQKLIECKWRHPATAASEARWWLGAIAAIVHQNAGPVTAESELEDRISAFFPGGGQIRSTASVARAARQLLRKELGYRCADGVCLDAAAFAVVENLKATARSIADDAGLIDEHELRARLLDETLWPHWETLLRQSRLQRLSGRLALRDTKKARLKAALLRIGRPATKEELREICGAAAPTRVSNYLSAMTGVVRADKKRWGLAEWVEDEYEGIPAEIVQRIEEDAGATRLERLVEELPRLFGVSENSVRLFCNAAMFVVDDGCGYGSAVTANRTLIRIRMWPTHEVCSPLETAASDCCTKWTMTCCEAADGICPTRRQRSSVSESTTGSTLLGRPTRLSRSRSLEPPRKDRRWGQVGRWAEAASATCGDMMSVVLDAGEMTVSVTVTDVNEYRPGWALIARLTGIHEQSGIEGLAGALKCSTGEVRATLRGRGDLAVFGAMPPRRSSPDLDDALAKLEAEVHRGSTL